VLRGPKAARERVNGTWGHAAWGHRARVNSMAAKLWYWGSFSHRGRPAADLQVEARHAQFGFNEVKTKQVPEWQNILWRYLDWVSLVIVSVCWGVVFLFGRVWRVREGGRDGN
jgi:hypothetical protein